jgi:hypothetical protein
MSGPDAGKCDACPVRRGLACPATTRPLPRFCTHAAAGHGPYRALIVAWAEGGPPPDPPVAPAGPGPDPETLRAAESCWHRDPGAGCCAGTRCDLSGRSVSIRDCLHCVRTAPL